MSRRRKHRKSRKRLAYGVIAVASSFCAFSYFSLHKSNQKFIKLTWALSSKVLLVASDVSLKPLLDKIQEELKKKDDIREDVQKDTRNLAHQSTSPPV